MTESEAIERERKYGIEFLKPHKRRNKLGSLPYDYVCEYNGKMHGEYLNVDIDVYDIHTEHGYYGTMHINKESKPKFKDVHTRFPLLRKIDIKEIKFIMTL